MNGFVQVPSKGQPMTAQWGADVANGLNAIRSAGQAGTLLTDGPTGTGFAPLPANLRDRRAIVADPLHPWKVFAVGKSKDVDHFFEIYIPDGSIVIGAKEVKVDGIKETETPKRFTFACETDVGERSTLHLVVYRDKEGESDKDAKNYKAILAVNIKEYENDESVRATIPIAELAVVKGDEYDKGKVVSQIEKEEIRIEDLEVPTDKVSIDKVTKEDAEDPDAIQFKNFDNEESDGGQGLAERLELEKSGSGESATYRIKAKSNDSKVHLVARVNGKIKYIPISGNDEKDPDEENPPPEDNPCTHPGDGDNGGGIKPDDREPGGGGGAGGGGGVAPETGGTHPGNDNCNCD